MPRRFDHVEIGMQLEMPAHRGAVIYADTPDTRDPERPIRVAIVTHIWHDPVEDKEFVGIAYLRNNGSYGKPTEKRTITGLARSGWREAKKDWVAMLQAMKDDGETVVPLFGGRNS